MGCLGASVQKPLPKVGDEDHDDRRRLPDKRRADRWDVQYRLPKGCLVANLWVVSACYIETVSTAAFRLERNKGAEPSWNNHLLAALPADTGAPL